MRHLAIAAVAALTLGGAAAAWADPAVGTWKTQAGDTGGYAHVAIKKCGANLCGTITQTFGESSDPDMESPIGKQIIANMGSDGGGSYSGGTIWAPDTDKTYKSKMSLKGNTLKVSGCVFGICRSQSWSRVN